MPHNDDKNIFLAATLKVAPHRMDDFRRGVGGAIALYQGEPYPWTLRSSFLSEPTTFINVWEIQKISEFHDKIAWVTKQDIKIYAEIHSMLLEEQQNLTILFGPLMPENRSPLRGPDNLPMMPAHPPSRRPGNLSALSNNYIKSSFTVNSDDSSFKSSYNTNISLPLRHQRGWEPTIYVNLTGQMRAYTTFWRLPMGLAPAAGADTLRGLFEEHMSKYLLKDVELTAIIDTTAEMLAAADAARPLPGGGR